MPKGENPLTAEELKFATLFVKFRDIYKAAERAKIPRTRATRVFNKPEVQDEIERQMEVVRAERAHVQVAEESLTNKLLDQELINLLRNPGTTESTKLDAIRLGMVATGRIQAGGTRILDLGAGEERTTGHFYQALVQVQPAAPIMPTEPAPGSIHSPAANTAPPAAAPAAASKPGDPGTIKL
jgi:hypothetical protein